MTGRPRTFDWDEARRRRATGMTYYAIAARLGVSDNAVMRACDDGFRKRADAWSRAAIENRRRPCLGGCGRRVWPYPAGRTGFCPQCVGVQRRSAQHGTESRYSRGCRCDACKRASREARAARRQRAAA